MGLCCHCHANMEEPKNVILTTEQERRAKSKFWPHPKVITDKPAEKKPGRTGLIEVGVVRRGVQKQTRALLGVANRNVKGRRSEQETGLAPLFVEAVDLREARTGSLLMESFKALFTKNSMWVGKLSFDSKEGSQTFIALEYRVLGFTRAGDIVAERILSYDWVRRSVSEKSIPVKMYFDVFFKNPEAEPVIIFKCEDSELVLVVDTRIKNANVNFDIENECLEGIGYQQWESIVSEADSVINEPTEPLPSEESSDDKSDDMVDGKAAAFPERRPSRVNVGEFFLRRLTRGDSDIKQVEITQGQKISENVITPFIESKSSKTEVELSVNLNKSLVYEKQNQVNFHEKIWEKKDQPEELEEFLIGKRDTPKGANIIIDSSRRNKEQLLFKGECLNSDKQIPMQESPEAKVPEPECYQWLMDERGPGYPSTMNG